MTDELIAKIPIHYCAKFGEWQPIICYIYQDRIEITYERPILYVGNIDHVKWENCRKKFDYQDLLVMNIALNKIFGDKQ